MKHFKLGLLSTVFLLFLIIPYAQAHDIDTSNGYFPSNSYYINFSPSTTLHVIYQDSSKWHFNTYWFSVDNANMTITNFFKSEDKLEFSLTDSGGTSTSQIYLYTLGRPKSVSGADSWNYSDASLVLTVYRSGVADVVVDWGSVGGGDTPKGGGVDVGSVIVKAGASLTLVIVGLVLVFIVFRSKGGRRR